MATAVREGGDDLRAPERAARESSRGGEASSAARKQRSRPLTYKGATGGVFKNAAVHVLRHERRLMSTGEVTKTAVRMGFIGSLPGKTPEATMASALYTDIKRWKAGIPGSVFCRPKEGLFGLREWSSDPTLAPLVASEKDDPFLHSGRAGSARRGGASGAADALRGSSWSDGSDASARSGSTHSGKRKGAKRAARRGGGSSAASSDEEEGLRLLLDAATGMGGEAEARQRDASEKAARESAKEAAAPRRDPTRAPSPPAGETGEVPRANVDATHAAHTSASLAAAAAAAEAWRDVSALASAPPGAASDAKKALDAAAAEARARRLDGVVRSLSARCAELYVLLGPHELVARDLAVLVVALRSGGARFAPQEKVVTEMLWELARAMAFPGGFGESAESRAALARVVAATIDDAAVRASASIAEAEAASARRDHEDDLRNARAFVAAAELSSAENDAAARDKKAAVGEPGAGAGAGAAGDADQAAAASSRLLASLQKSLERGASASASAYAALAAAAAVGAGGDAARTTPPAPRAE